MTGDDRTSEPALSPGIAAASVTLTSIKLEIEEFVATGDMDGLTSYLLMLRQTINKLWAGQEQMYLGDS